MLTSQELIEELKELGYKVYVDSLRMNIYRPFVGQKIFIGHISFGEKRGEIEVPYYSIPLPHLFTTDGNQQYLTFKDDTYFASKFNEKLKQTFDEEELERVPKFYRNLAVKIKD